MTEDERIEWLGEVDERIGKLDNRVHQIERGVVPVLYACVTRLEKQADEARSWLRPFIAWVVTISLAVLVNQCAHGVWG